MRRPAFRSRSLLLSLVASCLSLACGRALRASPEEEKTAPAPGTAIGEHVRADEEARTVTVEATAAEQEIHDVLEGAIEYVLVSRGGKDYETLFATKATPEELQRAFERIRLQTGRPAGEDSPPRGSRVRILVEQEKGAKRVRRPVEEFIAYKKKGKDGEEGAGKPIARGPWVYTGSLDGFDPESGKKTLQAILTRSIVGLHYTDPSALIQNGRAEARTENIYKANASELPRPGSRVRLIFEHVPAEVPEGTERVRVFISGRVQGVGFRAFTQREARRLEVNGLVKNLDDGRVEAVLEGSGERVRRLIAGLEKGPRAARVDRVERRKEEPLGDLDGFRIEY